jgi:P27 family predicted phage terminase small subunit
VLEGNPGKRPLNKQAPTPPAPPATPRTATFDDPPDEIAGTPAAAAEWRRLAPMLRRARAITDADRGALLALCLEWARYLDATAKVGQSGMVIQTKTGYPMQNPYIGIATKALSACTKLWPELGLTPSSRSRVKAGDGAPPADDWSEFDEPTTATPAPTPPDGGTIQ